MARRFEHDPTSGNSSNDPDDSLQYDLAWRDAFGPEPPPGYGENLVDWLRQFPPKTLSMLGQIAYGIGSRHPGNPERAALEAVLRAHTLLEEIRAGGNDRQDFVNEWSAHFAKSAPDDASAAEGLSFPRLIDGDAGGEGQLPLAG
jgi:hypothetical protein